MLVVWRTARPPGPISQISYAEWLEAIHPEDRAKAHEAMTAAQDPSGDGIYDIELRIRHPDGSVRWATAKGKVYFTPDAAIGDEKQRRPIRFIGIIRDVTKHLAKTGDCTSRGTISSSDP